MRAWGRCRGRGGWSEWKCWSDLMHRQETTTLHAGGGPIGQAKIYSTSFSSKLPHNHQHHQHHQHHSYPTMPTELSISRSQESGSWSTWVRRCLVASSRDEAPSSLMSMTDHLLFFRMWRKGFCKGMPSKGRIAKAQNIPPYSGYHLTDCALRLSSTYLQNKMLEPQPCPNLVQ